MLRLTLFATIACAVLAQNAPVVWSEAEKPIGEEIRGLRKVPDAERGAVTRSLAVRIRQLPASANKLTLAEGLADLSTEGDFGHATLQEVATTLSSALAERAAVSSSGMPEQPYVTLAQLVRYEHVTAPDNPLLKAAMARLQAEDQRRRSLDFTLRDLQGKEWTLSKLRGKVVLLNFWATWCEPCRKEMPDLEALSREFAAKGLLVLGISDDEPGKITSLVAERKYTYPILLDPGSKITRLMTGDGIPKSFVYDRTGNLVAEAMDMRTRGQFREMLAQAGLK
jgi:peroxiredoxin